MREQIIAAVRAALEGSRRVRITFKRERGATEDIYYLLTMHWRKFVYLNDRDLTTLWAVSKCDNWGNDSNRVAIVEFTPKFEEDFFVGRMTRALEKIEVVA